MVKIECLLAKKMAAPQRPSTNYNPINISNTHLPRLDLNQQATFITAKTL